MQTIEQLNEKFGIDKLARFDAGKGGLARLILTPAGGEAHVYLLGAHVLSFAPAGQKPVLFVGSKPFFEVGKAIRGGIPVVFPWFGPRDGDKSQMHGFVRTRVWEVAEISRAGDAVRAVFAFQSSPETRAIWDHDFAARFIVTVSAKLTTELEITNTSQADLTYEELLHSYFNVGDVRQISIGGFTGKQYIDKNNLGPHEQTDSANPLRFTKPEDRVYTNTTGPYTIEDPMLKRRLIVEKRNSDSTVVWNPWADKIGAFNDLSAEDWIRFICVESGNVKNHAITLKPGQTHHIESTVSVEAM